MHELPALHGWVGETSGIQCYGPEFGAHVFGSGSGRRQNGVVAGQILHRYPRFRAKKTWRKRKFVKSGRSSVVLCSVYRTRCSWKLLKSSAIKIGFQKLTALAHLLRHLNWKYWEHLEYLGGGMCFDGIQELTNIDEETVRRFFHVFCERFAVEFFPMYCCPPETKEDIDKVMNVYERLGLAALTVCMLCSWLSC